LKEVTHYLFSIGLSLYVLSTLHNLDARSLTMAVWLSFSVNFIIDLLGHVSRQGAPSRSWVTHSVFTAPMWGGAVGGLTLAAITSVLALRHFWTAITFWIIVGAIVAVGHLLLDSLTGAGVYFMRRRIALAHFSYDSQILNLGFIALGICLAVASLRV
jgi:hypothetical protein